MDRMIIDFDPVHDRLVGVDFAFGRAAPDTVKRSFRSIAIQLQRGSTFLEDFVEAGLDSGSYREACQSL
jgi:hypothetical protein